MRDPKNSPACHHGSLYLPTQLWGDSLGLAGAIQTIKQWHRGTPAVSWALLSSPENDHSHIHPKALCRSAKCHIHTYSTCFFNTQPADFLSDSFPVPGQASWCPRDREQKFPPVLAEVGAALGVPATRNEICIWTTKARSNQTMKGRFWLMIQSLQKWLPDHTCLKQLEWVLRLFILSTVLLSGNSHESQ